MFGGMLKTHGAFEQEHFGLGANQSADIEVRWPLGGNDTFKNVSANQLVTIREGSGAMQASVQLQS